MAESVEQNPPQGELDGQRAHPAPRGDAARRALAEAAGAAATGPAAAPARIGGREGPDPVRYGDWEVKGLASDF